MENKPKRAKVFFKDLSPHAWEHPADRAALKTLQNVPGLDAVIRTFFGATTEKSLRLMALASAVRVNERQFSKLYELHREACAILGAKEIPELYVSQNPFLNAGAIGMDKPFIVLNSSMIDALDEEELISVLGHELGHILSQHVLYKTLLRMLLQYSTALSQLPVTGLVLMGIIAALLEWDRKSELSADRAGLLVSQNPDADVRLLMKLAGGNHLDQMNLGEFMKQAEEYNESSTIGDTFYKMMNTVFQTHPYPVVRVYELINWVRSGEYENILRGEYASKTIFEDAKDAYKSYADNMKNATKPFKEVIDNVSEKAKEIFDMFSKKSDIEVK